MYIYENKADNILNHSYLSPNDENIYSYCMYKKNYFDFHFVLKDIL